MVIEIVVSKSGLAEIHIDRILKQFSMKYARRVSCQSHMEGVFSKNRYLEILMNEIHDFNHTCVNSMVCK